MKLRPEVVRVRAGVGRACFLIVGVCASGWLVLLFAPRTDPPISIAGTRPPISVLETRVPCRVSRDAIAAARDQRLQDPITRVLTAADDPCTIVVGTASPAYGLRHIFLSRDDGITFAEVLAGPGYLADIAVGDDGTVFALRPPFLGSLHPDGTSAWRIANLPERPGGPRDDVSSLNGRLVASGGWLAWIEALCYPTAVLGLTRDDGATWRFQEYPFGSDRGATLHIETTGVLHLLTQWTTERDNVASSAWLGNVDGRPLEWVDLPVGTERPWMAHDGHIYDLGEGSDLAQTGDVAVAQRDDGLVSLEAGRARILDRNPPAGFALLAVDARQRVLGLDHGKLVRRSPDGHWDVLLTAPVDTTE